MNPDYFRNVFIFFLYRKIGHLGNTQATMFLEHPGLTRIRRHFKDIRAFLDYSPPPLVIK
jgi:hypothetical protein